MQTADVVVVGGGCMGAATAYYLTRHGAGRVVLVERDTQLGTGSTGRNAGGVRHQFSDPANIALSRESIALFERFEDEVGTPIDFWQDGYLFLLASEASERQFAGSVALQRSLGLDVAWLSADEAAAMTPGLDVTGVRAATFCAKDGIADPNGVTMGLAKAAQARGLTVLRDTEVTGIDVSSGGVAGVTTSAGPIATRAVVIAAGPVGRPGRRPGRRGAAHRAGTAPHLHRAARLRARLGRARSCRPDAAIAAHGDRLRHDVLLPS